MDQHRGSGAANHQRGAVGVSPRSPERLSSDLLARHQGAALGPTRRRGGVEVPAARTRSPRNVQRQHVRKEPEPWEAA